MLNDVIFGVEVLHDPLILYEDRVEISKICVQLFIVRVDGYKCQKMILDSEGDKMSKNVRNYPGIKMPTRFALPSSYKKM